MSRKKINSLLDKYYQGETSLQEEALLRDEIRQKEDISQEEKDIFEYFENEAFVPENLEAKIFENIERKNKQPKIIRMPWFRYSSIAAAVCLFASIFWFTMKSQPAGQLSNEEQFAILEHALLEISYGVQPAQDEDLLVLFQDENLEIVMN